jgi:hypothetical protein
MRIATKLSWGFASVLDLRGPGLDRMILGRAGSRLPVSP